MQDTEKITINGVDYIRADTVRIPADELDGQPFVIVRTRSAGVFAGYVARRDGLETELLQARRLWYWKGAASLSQLAIDGVANPSECKFPAAVDSILLTETIEIIPATEKAKQSINGVEIWQV